MSPNIRYFVPISWFVAITHFLEDSVQKKGFLGSNTVFNGQEVPFYMVCNIYTIYCISY